MHNPLSWQDKKQRPKIHDTSSQLCGLTAPAGKTQCCVAFSHMSLAWRFSFLFCCFFSFTNLFDHAQAFISSTCSGQLFIMPLGDSLCLVCLFFWFCLRFVYFWFLFCFLFFFRIVMAPLGPCKGSPTVRSLLVLQQYGPDFAG